MADATPDEAGADLVDRWLTHRDGGADARAAELRRQGAALRERTGRPAPPEGADAPASERRDSTTLPPAPVPAASRELDAYDAAPARPLPPSGGIRPGLGLADFEPVIIPSARRPKPEPRRGLLARRRATEASDAVAGDTGNTGNPGDTGDTAPDTVPDTVADSTTGAPADALPEPAPVVDAAPEPEPSPSPAEPGDAVAAGRAIVDLLDRPAPLPAAEERAPAPTPRPEERAPAPTAVVEERAQRASRNHPTPAAVPTAVPTDPPPTTTRADAVSAGRAVFDLLAATAAPPTTPPRAATPTPPVSPASPSSPSSPSSPTERETDPASDRRRTAPATSASAAPRPAKPTKPDKPARPARPARPAKQEKPPRLARLRQPAAPAPAAAPTGPAPVPSGPAPTHAPAATPEAGAAPRRTPAAARSVFSDFAHQTRGETPPRPAPSGPPPQVDFAPRAALRRLVGLLVLAGVVTSGYLAWQAWQVRTEERLGLAGIALLSTAVVWAVWAGSSPPRLSVRGGQLEIRRSGGRQVFDLANRYTDIELLGTPGRRGWRVLIHRRGMSPVEIDSSMVDPRGFTAVLRYYRPDL